MLVSTNSGILLSACCGLEGPKALVNENAVSRDMYVVAIKKERLMMPKGFSKSC
jgi:hypothetical protein